MKIYNKATYIRVIIVNVIYVSCLIYFYKSLNTFEFCFGLFITLSYNYKLLSVRKCPKCGRYMKKIYRDAIFLPNVEVCEYDGIEYEIKYIGENNI